MEQSGTLSSRVVRWVTAVYWLALTAMLLLPRPWAGLGILRETPEGWDRPGHVLGFALLAWLNGASWGAESFKTWFLTLTCYAGLIEIAQYLIPSRTVDLPDFLSNLVGLLIGSLVWRVTIQKKSGSK